MNDADSKVLTAIAMSLMSHPDYRVLRRIPFMPKISQATPEERASWRKIVILDTETTSLDTKFAKVIELGLSEVFYALDAGVPTLKDFGRCESWFEDPGEPLSDETKRVTGITDEDVAGKRIPDDIVAEFLADAVFIVAHNAAYDRPIAERRFPYMKHYDWACSSAEIDWNGKFKSPSNALTVLAWNAGMFFDAHRAANDCAALAYLLVCVRIGNESPLSMLIASASIPWVRLFATGAAFENKDTLKARGYSWDADRKVWRIDKKEPAAADAEQAWLKTEILYGREPNVKVIAAVDRYSERE